MARIKYRLSAMILAGCLSGAGFVAGADGGLSFNRDIRPILSENCFACHGPDSAARKADLRLDQGQVAVQSADNAEGVIVPGKPGDSELVARILAKDPDEVMPPPDSHKKLTAEQRQKLQDWIGQGAEYEPHWSFIPPQKSKLPGIQSDWIRSEIDRFVLRRLKEAGLEPSPEADKRSFIRRASFDLTGLPPTIEEIDAFLADETDAAPERLIDRLLKSQAFGEHRARYWLDAARYGDTHGLHLDNYREIWPYRDWVIRAFNDNKPFDVFTVEQLAGDLLPEATQSQRVATGFNRCNVTTSEGGAIAEEFLVRYAVDRVNTTSTVWMGLTAQCAQCHDHKYDPLKSKEFYQLFAFFNNTTQPGMDGNSKESPPVIRVYPGEKERQRAETLRAEIGKLDGELKNAAKANENDFQIWQARADLEKTIGHARLSLEQETGFAGTAGGKAIDLGNAGDFQADKSFTVALRYKVPDEDGQVVLLGRTDSKQNGRGWRVVWQDWGIQMQLIESWPGKTLRTGVTRRIRPGASGHFAISYDGSKKSNGIRLYMNGSRLQSRFVNEWVDTLDGDFKTAAKLLAGGPNEDGLVPEVSEVRLFDRRLTAAEVKAVADASRIPAIARKPADKRNDKEKGDLRNVYLQAFSKPYQGLLTRKSALEAALSVIETRAPYTLVMEERAGEEPKAHLLDRGEYDQPGEAVEPGVPEFLPAMDENAPSNRLGLAQWLTRPDHPLTARVFVNRAWQEIFGTGLVKTSEDFGIQGEAPSHPELLDWLAVTFVESGWDVKALYKRLLMSATYRQDSRVTPELTERDPGNRLLARGPRYRLDAETLRDQVLFASGLLDKRIGGPGVKPWQPGGIWKVVGYTNSNTQTFSQDFGAAEHRRSLYTFWKRTAPPPNMKILDAPNREDCVVRRERTNTPLQALVMMNDPQFVRAARHLAARAARERTDLDGRLDFLALVLLARPMDADEKAVVKASLTKFQNAWSSDEAGARAFLVDSVNPAFSILAKESPAELASLAMVASQLMNLDEAVNKN